MAARGCVWPPPAIRENADVHVLAVRSRVLFLDLKETFHDLRDTSTRATVNGVVQVLALLRPLFEQQTQSRDLQFDPFDFAPQHGPLDVAPQDHLQRTCHRRRNRQRNSP